VTQLARRCKRRRQCSRIQYARWLEPAHSLPQTGLTDPRFVNRDNSYDSRVWGNAG